LSEQTSSSSMTIDSLSLVPSSVLPMSSYQLISRRVASQCYTQMESMTSFP